MTGKVILPNDGEYDLRGCFVTAAAYGDISSERALLRTDRLSCRIHNRIIDQKIKGHVSFMGKNGIRATPVIRNGKIVGYAFAGGAIDAMGSAMSSVGSTTVGLGSSHSVTSGDVARAGLGGEPPRQGRPCRNISSSVLNNITPSSLSGQASPSLLCFRKVFSSGMSMERKQNQPARHQQKRLQIMASPSRKRC
ncbi:hypothetical protein LNO81_30195 [Klebsiella variicola subsp. variicola]|nr:hypothetical protein [Klebsiella variicola subsp. variicola]